MSIVYPLSLPASPRPNAVTLGANDITGVSSSPFSATQEVFLWSGTFWTLHLAYPTMNRVHAEPLLAILTALRGRWGTFYAGDPAAATPQGIATGTPLVNGANASGAVSLVTKGWTATKTGILKAGDYLQIGSGITQRLYKNLTDANSDGSGNATFDIFPPLRESLTDSTPIVVNNCMGTFRLASDALPWDVAKGPVYNVSFDAVEAL